MSRILGIVHACAKCPHKQYYSAGQYECNAVGEILPREILEQGRIAEWCPLAPHPAHEMERMRKQLQSPETQPTEPT